MYFFPLLFGINFESFSSLRGRSPQPPPPDHVTVSPRGPTPSPPLGSVWPCRCTYISPWLHNIRLFGIGTQVQVQPDSTAVFSPGVEENAPTSHPFGGYEVRNSQNDCVNLPFLRFFCYTLFFIEGADFPSWWVSPSHLKDIWITNRGSKRAKNK